MWGIGLTGLTNSDLVVITIFAVFILFFFIRGIGLHNRMKSALDLSQESINLQKKTIERLDVLIEEVRKLKR